MTDPQKPQHQGPDGVADLRRPEHVERLQNAAQRGNNPVFVDPGVNAVAAMYAASAAQRSAARRAAVKQALPKYAEPVGGGPGPHIPPLTAPFEQGLTMEQQAERLREAGRQAAMQAFMQEQGQNPQSIVEPVALSPTMANMGARPRPQQPQLLNDEMLPEEATRDPAFQQGQGSMFAISQPALALRYGVMRKGRRVPPQALLPSAGPGGQARQLSPQTLEGLQALEKLQQASREKMKIQGMPQTEAEANAQADAGPAGHSAQAGKLPDGVADTPAAEKPKLTAEEEAKVKEAIKNLDSFDYDTLRQIMAEDVINNPGQKKIIEDRCEPMRIEDLVMKNRVSQRVPIVPGKFEPTYTSMTGEEDLALKRLVMQESKSVEVTERYLLDKYAFMSITCGLTALNGNPAPSHLNEQGDFDDKKFWLKFHWVMKRPLHMLSAIGINHGWFERRVRAMFVAEKLGNG